MVRINTRRLVYLQMMSERCVIAAIRNAKIPKSCFIIRDMKSLSEQGFFMEFILLCVGEKMSLWMMLKECGNFDDWFFTYCRQA